MLDYKFGDRLPVLDHGHVALLDTMGNDADIVKAARVSYDGQGRSENRALIRYLLRHKHTSPFEMAEMKFELKMPLFVARQWVRHRTASMNEVSARYTELPDDMFVPEFFAVQSADNKQGRGDEFPEDIQGKMRGLVSETNDSAYGVYLGLLEAGVAKEIARGVLPLNIYTKFVWKMDLHNLMHFLNLRLDPHAQQEIREYAEVMQKLVALHFPITFEAFVDYTRDAYTCSRMEVDALRYLVAGLRSELSDRPGVFERHLEMEFSRSELSKREQTEFRKRFIDG